MKLKLILCLDLGSIPKIFHFAHANIPNFLKNEICNTSGP
jgi:hypothetical protein